MKNEELLRVINQRDEDMKALIDMQTKLINAEIGAVTDIMNVQFKQVLEKQDHTNGSLGEHGRRLEELEAVTRPQSWGKKHWKAAVIIFILGTYVLYAVFELYSIVDIIKAIK